MGRLLHFGDKYITKKIKNDVADKTQWGSIKLLSIFLYENRYNKQKGRYCGQKVTISKKKRGL